MYTVKAFTLISHSLMYMHVIFGLGFDLWDVQTY